MNVLIVDTQMSNRRPFENALGRIGVATKSAAELDQLEAAQWNKPTLWGGNDAKYGKIAGGQ